LGSLLSRIDAALEFIGAVKTEGSVSEVELLCDVVARLGAVAVP